MGRHLTFLPQPIDLRDQRIPTERGAVKASAKELILGDNDRLAPFSPGGDDLNGVGPGLIALGGADAGELIDREVSHG
jgi:hypothetical protein